MSSLRQVFYVSHSLAQPHEIERILNGARQANERRRITGVLFHTGAYFAQLLEGEPTRVRETLHDISTDTRHKDVRVLMDRAAGIRMCDGWRMAFLDSPGADALMSDLHASRAVSLERVDNLLGLLLREVRLAEPPTAPHQPRTIAARNS